VSPSGATTTDNGLPRTIAQLEITYSNGTTTTIGTDGTWQTTLGPTTVSAWWGGESYDARLEVPGWNLPGTNRASWSNVFVTTAPFPSTQLAPRAAPALTVVQQIAGTDMGSPVAGSELYNFGVNTAGREQFTITRAGRHDAHLHPRRDAAERRGLPERRHHRRAGVRSVHQQWEYRDLESSVQLSRLSVHPGIRDHLGGEDHSPTQLVVRANNSAVGTSRARMRPSTRSTRSSTGPCRAICTACSPTARAVRRAAGTKKSICCFP
jgi:hypothetical protein